MQIGYNPIFISGHFCVILMTMSIYPPINQYTDKVEQKLKKKTPY